MAGGGGGGGGGGGAAASGGSTNSLGTVPNGRLLRRKRRGKIRKREGDNSGIGGALQLAGAESLAEYIIRILKEAEDDRASEKT